MVSRMCGYGVKIVVARTHAKVFSFFTIQRATNDFDVCLELEREMREDYEIATVKIKTLLFFGEADNNDAHKLPLKIMPRLRDR